MLVIRRTFAAAWFIALSMAPAARADTSNVALSEVLFRDGRDLLARRQYAEACPKLAESYRLDPATGTLLALALCHERQGKFASAWAEYNDVASRSRAEARRDRQVAARTRALELEPMLSAVTIALAEGAGVPGLEIRRNGVVVETAWLGTAVPLDGGVMVIDATAPGKKPWQTQITLAASDDRITVTVPRLDNAESSPPRPVPSASLAPGPRSAPAERPGPASLTPSSPVAPAPPAASPASASAAASPRHGHLSPLQVGSIVSGVASVAALGAWATFGLLAKMHNDDSKGQCMGDLCTVAGQHERLVAVRDGNIATAALVGGSVLAFASVLMLGGSLTMSGPSESAFQAVPMAGPHEIGGLIQSCF
jgi:hypothetical protein